MHLASILAAAGAGVVLGQAIVLPKPDGPYGVRVRTTQLTDFSRNDTSPGAPGNKPRSLMLSVFLPTKDKSECTSPYMLPKVARIESNYWQHTGPPDNPQNFTADFSRFRLSACSEDVSHGAQGTYPDESTPFPVVFFSPGRGVTRFYYSVTAQFLAATGYIVITVDHPYTVDVVEYPDGSIITASRDKEWTYAQDNRTVDMRAADLTFIADQLERNATLATLLFPSVRPLMKKLGVWGHSFGGATAAEVMRLDTRFGGGIDLDGTTFGKVMDTGLSRPFVLWQGSYGHNRTTDPTWPSFWSHSTGWKRNIQLADSVHLTFGDCKLLADTYPFTPADFGTLGGLRTIQILAAYAHDFFAFVLQGKGPGLMGGPSKAYPEVTFIP